MNRIRSTLTILAALVASPVGAQSANALLQEGNKAWTRNQCVRAARNYYALQVRYPDALKGAASRDLNTRIDWCEQNTSLYSGQKADGTGAASPKKPDNVPDNVSASGVNRCTAYAQLAIAHYQSNVVDGCNYSGNRWSDSETRHYQWCTSVGNGELDRENSGRQQALIDCHRATGDGNN